MKKLSLILAILTIIFFNSFSQTNYYISESADSQNDCLSETNPCNLEKFNTIKISDFSKVLFKKGEVFRGEIATLKSPTNIVYTSYGEGENPILKGSIIIKNWKKNTNGLSENVYESDVTSQVPESGIIHVFINGEPATIARYPNAFSPKQYGDNIWLETDGSDAAQTFFDKELADYGKPDNYWTGATLRIRNYSWTYTVGEISNYTAKTGTVKSDRLGKEQLPGWGYFIDGKLEELDYPNEWFYDKTTKKLYVYCPKGENPENNIIEAIIYETGISITNHEDNCSVSGIDFAHYASKAININSSNNISIENCKISYCQQGIYFWNCANTKIIGNLIHNCFQNSIVMTSEAAFENGKCIVSENTILNSAMMPLYTSRWDGTQTPAAINVALSNSLVEKNIIRNTCYSGITLKGTGGHFIEKNVIDSTMILLNDGGCIQLSDAGNNTIRNNFLSNAIGNTDKSNGWGSSSGMHHPSYGMGIGADPTDPQNIIAENNTVFNNHDVGIRYNGADNSSLKNNTFYGNHDEQILLTTNDDACSKISIEDNILYGLSVHARGLVIAFTKNGSTIEKADRNYYCNPYN